MIDARISHGQAYERIDAPIELLSYGFGQRSPILLGPEETMQDDQWTSVLVGRSGRRIVV